MTDVKNLQVQKQKEMEFIRQQAEMKRVKENFAKDYHKVVKTNEKQIELIQKDYETKTSGLENELEQKLMEIRNKHKITLSEESARLNNELNNLKKTHQDKVEEIKVAQTEEIGRMVNNHEENLSNATKKFEKEKAKTEYSA
jgi:hypothetical protein